MKKVLIFLGLLLLCLFVGSVSAMSGSGTASDPYILTTSADLVALSGTGIAGYNVSGYYELGADIDMSDVASFTPIGVSSARFSGHFDGKNHTISNLAITSTGSYNGLFSYITNGVTISNIIFTNANLNVGGYSGVLFGVCNNANNGVISNICVYNSSITNTGSLVGMIGGGGALSSSSISFNNCIVKGCYINSGSNSIGGITGYGAQSSSSISYTDCSVIDTCLISDSQFQVGGISGIGAQISSSASVSNCNVINCYIKGGRTTTSYVGGIFGYATNGEGCTCSITDCNVQKLTIVCGGQFGGGLYGCYRANGGVPEVIDCSVSEVSLIGVAYIGGVAGGYYLS